MFKLLQFILFAALNDDVNQSANLDVAQRYCKSLFWIWVHLIGLEPTPYFKRLSLEAIHQAKRYMSNPCNHHQRGVKEISCQIIESVNKIIKYLFKYHWNRKIENIVCVIRSFHIR
eukprot:139235_1